MNKSRYILVFSIIILIIALTYNLRNKIINTERIQREESNPKVSVEMDKDIFLQEDDTKQDIIQKAKTPINNPIIKDPNAISAEAYMIGDLDTDKIYLQYNSSKIFPIASLSKLFTALIAKHILDPEKTVNITEEILKTEGDAGHLVQDEVFTTKELLYPLLMESSNDAAEALAESYGYSRFIIQMNQFARELGMMSTRFNDATGLSSQNISNVKDLFILSKYLFENESSLLEITKQKTFDLATTTNMVSTTTDIATTTTKHQFHHFISINPYVFYSHFLGGKTGRTNEAKESMISLFEYTSDSITHNIAIIILRSEFGQREIDTEKLIMRFLKEVKQ